jgi:hypothetical protein
MRNLIQKIRKNKEGAFMVTFLIAWVLLNIVIAEPLRQARRHEKKIQAVGLHAKVDVAGLKAKEATLLTQIDSTPPKDAKALKEQLWDVRGELRHHQQEQFFDGLTAPLKILILPALLYAEESKFGRR